MSSVRLGGINFKLYKTLKGTWKAYTRIGRKSYVFHRGSKESSIEAAKAFADGHIQPLPEKVHIERKQAETLFESEKLLKPFGISILEAVQFYARHNSGLVQKLRLNDAINKFINSKLANSSSRRYLEVLRSYLGKLNNNLGSSLIHEITAIELNQFFRSQKGSARHRNNLRNYTVTLFRWAKKQGFLPDKITEAEKTDLAKEAETEITILSPEQLTKLIDFSNNDEVAKAYFVFGAFTGIRTAELERLTWEDIHTNDGHIEIAASKAKTASRRLVPILPNFKKWITFLKNKGRILKGRPRDHIKEPVKKVLGSWPANCLRHSFISYRLAEIQNVAQVALEAGNSPNKIFTNYRQIRLTDRRLVTQELAKKWFSITP